MIIGIEQHVHNYLCYYCNRSIDFDFPGWGLMLDDQLDKIHFHNECFSIFEDVEIA